MLSKIDLEQIEQLYELLTRAENEHNFDAAAALRWAIYRLEGMS